MVLKQLEDSCRELGSMRGKWEQQLRGGGTLSLGCVSLRRLSGSHMETSGLSRVSEPGTDKRSG